MCAAVVKASGVYQKETCPACNRQKYLIEIPGFIVFLHPVTGQRKLFECVHVDGASDEGPSHLEVQVFWTDRHIEKQYFVTLVSVRSSDSSNKIELQNGCLALGHTDLFIPFTLNVSNLDPATGNHNKERFVHNMDLATDVYLNRVDQSHSGGMTIHKFKGADSSGK